MNEPTFTCLAALSKTCPLFRHARCCLSRLFPLTITPTPWSPVRSSTVHPPPLYGVVAPEKLVAGASDV